MSDYFTAFDGQRRLASGVLAEVALKVKAAAERQSFEPILIFNDATGRAVDLDLRGSTDDVLARLARSAAASEAPDGETPEPRGRGRPRLGVVAREVTLLPRHWEWLNAQAGGASVALRKLVEQARRINGEADRQRAACEAAYCFMSTMAGNLSGFEEASRALFANDRHAFERHIASWPEDIRDYAIARAFGSGEALRARTGLE